MTSTVKRNIWENKKYYQKIASWEDYSHPGFLKIKKYCQDAGSILDVGCGDGSKLAELGNRDTEKTGVEVSKEAVNMGLKKHPGINFVVYAGEKLPFSDNKFSAVVCLFVLEHTDDPKRVIDEIVRVTMPSGKFFFLAPNFGAPNRASPNFVGNRWHKLFTGFKNDFSNLTSLGWNKVNPTIENIDQFESDLDTTVEPYLNSLIKYLESSGISVVETNSFWSMELSNRKLLQRTFRLLGSLGLYPFKYWGPHLFVVGQKNS